MRVYGDGVRIRLAAVLIAACCVPATAATAATPRALVKHVENAFKKKAPPGTKPDLTPLMRRLALALPRLHGAEHRRAASLLARPSQGSR